MSETIHQIKANELELMEGLMSVFAEVFSDSQTYTENRPSDNYLRSLLSRDYFIALVAMDNDEDIGGLTAYEIRAGTQ